jgi:hypothetical protein
MSAPISICLHSSYVYFLRVLGRNIARKQYVPIYNKTIYKKNSPQKTLAYWQQRWHFYKAKENIFA